MTIWEHGPWPAFPSPGISVHISEISFSLLQSSRWEQRMGCHSSFRGLGRSPATRVLPTKCFTGICARWRPIMSQMRLVKPAWTPPCSLTPLLENPVSLLLMEQINETMSLTQNISLITPSQFSFTGWFWPLKGCRELQSGISTQVWEASIP